MVAMVPYGWEPKIKPLLCGGRICYGMNALLSSGRKRTSSVCRQWAEAPNDEVMWHLVTIVCVCACVLKRSVCGAGVFPVVCTGGRK